MKKSTLYIVIAAVAIIGIGGYFLINKKDISEITSDKTIESDYRVESGQRLVLKNNATLTIKGDFEALGEIECENGSVRIIVEGNATIDSNISCQNPQARTGEETPNGIYIIAKNSFTFSKNARLESNGNIQIVENSNLLAQSEADVEKLFNEAAQNTGEGKRIGPFSSEAEEEVGVSNVVSEIYAKSQIQNDQKENNSFFGINAAHADSHTVVIGGKISVTTPPQGMKRIVVFLFPTANKLSFESFELTGPDGRAGQDDKESSCNAKGQKGEDAFRMLVIAPNIAVNDFTLKLGSGGKGGDAETKKDCDHGIAIGGKGGEPSNFKMIAQNDFSINGSFMITPGRGGEGGMSKAFGKDGGPKEKGGDATSNAGDGGNNNKTLNVGGVVSGTENVQFGSAIGGNGGNAIAMPGKGGDGEKCGEKGGDGGKGSATGGKGGNASLKVSGGAVRSLDSEDAGGKGGDAESKGGKGGNGGNCDSKGPGGNGGKGGDADSKFGKGGMGTDKNGDDGKNNNQTGGDGGNGGDGCKEGKGGKGGKGIPPGVDGKDGKNVCIIDEETKDVMIVPSATPSPKTEASPEPKPTPEEKIIIKAIKYQGKFLPVDQLIIENEEGCGADHWHAKIGAVRATDNSMIGDPGPQCGYGKVKENPAIDIEVSANFKI